MFSIPKILRLLLVGVVLLSGCAATHPLAYKDLASSSELVPNPRDKSGHIPFQYSVTRPNWPLYNRVIFDPVTIYRGMDQQFGKLSEANKMILADYMRQQFLAALKVRYLVTTAPGVSTLRVHVSLTGAETNTPVLGTLKELVPMGIVVNSVKSVADKQGQLTGSVSYAVEVYDSVSNRLLRAYVSKQYPAAENVVASLGTLTASETAIRKGAKVLLAEFQ